MQIGFIKAQGSGNDFPMIDARGMSLDDASWARIARALADRDGPVGGDGLLLLTDGDEGHEFGMRMFNSDGSEAETCLNGLRCIARLGFETLGLSAARVRLKTSSAEVARADDMAPGVVTIRTRAGPASTASDDVGVRIRAARIVDAVIDGLPNGRRFTGVAMPNPHLVSFVEAIDEDELVAIGKWCEAAPPLIPARANVSFVEMRGADTLYVRTFERGVGLTDSCGSAMAAATFAAALTGRAGFGDWLTVLNRGGMVSAMAEAPEQGAMVVIAGNASFLYDASVTIELGEARAHDVIRHHLREDEARAWSAVTDRAASERLDSDQRS